MQKMKMVTIEFEEQQVQLIYEICDKLYMDSIRNWITEALQKGVNSPKSEEEWRLSDEYYGILEHIEAALKMGN